MDIGKRLTFFRLKALHTQDSLAAQSKVSRQAISSIENGRASPTFATLCALLSACDTTMEDFVFIGAPKQLSERDQALHCKLQEILDSNSPAAEGIAINIEFLHGHMLTLMRADAEKERQSKVRRKKAG